MLRELEIVEQLILGQDPLPAARPCTPRKTRRWTRPVPTTISSSKG
jgi:hypothetical protein